MELKTQEPLLLLQKKSNHAFLNGYLAEFYRWIFLLLIGLLDKRTVTLWKKMPSTSGFGAIRNSDSFVEFEKA